MRECRFCKGKRVDKYKKIIYNNMVFESLFLKKIHGSRAAIVCRYRAVLETKRPSYLKRGRNAEMYVSVFFVFFYAQKLCASIFGGNERGQET